MALGLVGKYIPVVVSSVVLDGAVCMCSLATQKTEQHNSRVPDVQPGSSKLEVMQWCFFERPKSPSDGGGFN
jgi:hypothetical protein